MSISGRGDKSSVAQACNDIQLGSKKAGTMDIGNDTDQSQKPAEKKNPDPKRNMLANSRSNSRRGRTKKQISGFLGVGGGRALGGRNALQRRSHLQGCISVCENPLHPTLAKNAKRCIFCM